MEQIEKYMHLLYTGQSLTLDLKVEPESGIAAGILTIKYDRNLTEQHPIDMTHIGPNYLNEITNRGVTITNQ